MGIDLTKILLFLILTIWCLLLKWFTFHSKNVLSLLNKAFNTWSSSRVKRLLKAKCFCILDFKFVLISRSFRSAVWGYCIVCRGKCQSEPNQAKPDEFELWMFELSICSFEKVWDPPQVYRKTGNRAKNACQTSCYADGPARLPFRFYRAYKIQIDVGAKNKAGKSGKERRYNCEQGWFGWRSFF